MPRDNRLPLKNKTTKIRNSNKIPGTNSMQILKWTNVYPSDQCFTNPQGSKTQPIEMQPLLNKIYLGTNPIKGKTEQKIMQNTLNKVELRAASQTVNNSMNNDTDLLLGIQQTIKITLPPCSEILAEGNDVPFGMNQNTLPNFNEFKSILGANDDFSPWPSQGEDAVPPIHCMLPPGYI